MAVKKLPLPIRKIILSNIHAGILNSVILEALYECGIKILLFSLHVCFSKDINSNKNYNYVVSFSRAIYIIKNKQDYLADSILIKYKDEIYFIFLMKTNFAAMFTKVSTINHPILYYYGSYWRNIMKCKLD